LKHFLNRLFAAAICLCLLAGSVTACAQEKDQVFSDISVIDVNGRQLRLADWETMSFEEILTQLESAGFVITKAYVYVEDYKRVEWENGLTHDVLMNAYNSYDFTKNSYITLLFASDPVVENGKTLSGLLEFSVVSGITVSCGMASDAKFGAVGASGEKMRNGDFSELTGAYPLTAGGSFQYGYLTRDYSYCAGGDPGRAVGINAGAQKYEFCTNRWKPDHTAPKEELKPEPANPELLGALSTITYNGKTLKLSELSQKTGPEILDTFADFGFPLRYNGTDPITAQQAKDIYNAPEFTRGDFTSRPTGQDGEDEVRLWFAKDLNEVEITISNRRFDHPATTFTAAGISAGELKIPEAPRLRAEYPQLRGTLYGGGTRSGSYTYKNGDSKVEFRNTVGDNYGTMVYLFSTKYKN
jgi:hypothetical protein